MIGKLIGKVVGSALASPAIAAKEAEEAIDEAGKTITDAWDRLTDPPPAKKDKRQ